MSQFQDQDVYNFWFSDLSPEDWFSGGEELDARIKERFGSVHAAVAAGECADWRKTAKGRLAEVIVLDQFSRNMYRGTARAFATDGQALVLAQEAIRAGAEKELGKEERHFLYMPFMHSESREIQEESLRLFTELGDESALHYANVHKDIIDRFGRYPHRNAQLGRGNTPEEEAYLKEESEAFFDS